MRKQKESDHITSEERETDHFFSMYSRQSFWSTVIFIFDTNRAKCPFLLEYYGTLTDWSFWRSHSLLDFWIPWCFWEIWACLLCRLWILRIARIIVWTMNFWIVIICQIRWYTFDWSWNFIWLRKLSKLIVYLHYCVFQVHHVDPYDRDVNYEAWLQKEYNQNEDMSLDFFHCILSNILYR
jgi:hypothetical protein